MTDGPFAEAKELIAGFAVVQVESKDEAIEWATRFADVIGDVEIEVRQVIELSDFVPENAPPETGVREGRTGTPLAETDPTNEGGSK
ncbi:MAG: YciI family protein [Rubrobacteraceae bacterium]